MALRLGRSKLWRDLTLDQLRFFAARLAIPEGLTIRAAQETVARFRELWPDHAEAFELPSATKRVIDQYVAALPIAN